MKRLITAAVLTAISSAYSGYAYDSSSYYGRRPSQIYDYQYTDQEIISEIHSVLEKNHSDLKFALSNKNVILYGEISNPHERIRIKREIQNINGVNNVYFEKGDEAKQQDPPSPDQRVSDEIQKKLDLFKSAYKDVKVEVKNGLVTLSGKVSSLEDKLNLNKLVNKIEGVGGINNEVTARDQNKGDYQLSEEIQARLDDLKKLYHDVEVDVEKGWVTLRGKVSTLEEKMHLDELISKFEGVFGIKNEVTVKHHDKDDYEVGEEVQARLDDLKKLYRDVDVKVKHGWVTLKGEVSTLEERMNLDKLVSKIEGVVGIKNKVTVEHHNKDDHEVTEEIHARLGDLKKLYHDVEVEVNKGWVTLKGDVSTLEEKMNLDKVISKFEGVVGIKNEVSVRHPSKGDQHLADEIQNQMDTFKKAYQNVEVYVKNGWVTLKGEVSTLEEKLHLEKMINKMKGVVGIENKVTVNKQRQPM